MGRITVSSFSKIGDVTTENGRNIVLSEDYFNIIKIILYHKEFSVHIEDYNKPYHQKIIGRTIPSTACIADNRIITDIDTNYHIESVYDIKKLYCISFGVLLEGPLSFSPKDSLYEIRTNNFIRLSEVSLIPRAASPEILNQKEIVNKFKNNRFLRLEIKE